MNLIKKLVQLPLRAVERRLERIEQALIVILERTKTMALDFFRLEAEIAENNDAIASAVALIQAVAQEIRDNAANQAKVAELADRLDAQSKVLADAVVANTPAAPTE